MLLSVGDSGKFRISESVFRFGADVRAGDDPREAQLRMIRDGEAVIHDEAPTQGSLLDAKHGELEFDDELDQDPQEQQL